MNFLVHRHLVQLSLSYIIALGVSAYLPTHLRPTIVCLLSLFLFAVAITILIRSKYKHNRLFAEHRQLLCCILCSAVALILPLFMFNVKNHNVSGCDGETVKIKATVTKVNAEENEYASLNARVFEINGQKADFTLLVFCEFSPQISSGNIFESNLILSNDIDHTYYPEMVCRRHNILYSATISSNNNFEITARTASLAGSLDVLSRRVGYSFERLFSRNTAALAKALLLGDKHELPKILSRDFSRAGISHLLALSGMHLALVTVLVIGLLKPVIKSKRARFIITSLLSVFIMMFTGGSASIVRAGLMLIYYQAGYLFRDKSDILTSLFAVTAGILIADPYSIFDSGLILSVCATFGIAITLEFTFTLSTKLFGAPYETGILKSILSVLFQSLSISFFAGLFANCAAYFFFDRISLISTVSTLLFTPLIVLFMILSATALLLSPICLAIIPTSLAEIVCKLITGMCSRISSLDNIIISTKSPIISIFIIFFIVFLFFCIASNKLKTIFAAGAIFLKLTLFACFTVYNLLSFDPQVHIIARQNESGFFISNRHTSAFIDISYGSDEINANANTGVCEHLDTDLDYYILSHYHFDHIKALRRFNEYTLVRQLLLPIPENDTDSLYADMLIETAKQLDIKYEYYQPDKLTDIAGVSLRSLALERKNKSSHPYINLLLEYGDKSIVYSSGLNEISRQYEDFQNMINSADTVIASTHPKPERELSKYISEKTQLITFAEEYMPGNDENDIHLPYVICKLLP